MSWKITKWLKNFRLPQNIPKYCSADDLQCGNGCERIQHPIEMDGAEWYKKGDWSDLLSDEQRKELGLMDSTPVKPHIKLVLQK